MNRRVHVLSLAETGRHTAWEAYADRASGASGYHGLVWPRIIREAFGHPAYPLAAYAGDRITGILPLVLVAGPLFGRFRVSLPFVNYGGLLADDAESASALLEEARALMMRLRARSVELRHTGVPRLGLPALGHKASLILPLPGDPDLLWNGLKDKVRNQVRKARKNGLETVEGHAELLDDFYRVFCVNMRALGTPVYGRIFFERILARLPKTTRVLAVRRNGRCLAAGVLYRHKDRLEMPWASSLPESRPLCANVLLYWQALRRACQSGCRTFDFGRSSPDSGPWRFKRQWGADPLPLSWEYLLAPGMAPPDLNTQNPRFQAAIGLWKRLPLAVTNALGPRIVRCIP